MAKKRIRIDEAYEKQQKLSKRLRELESLDINDELRNIEEQIRNLKEEIIIELNDFNKQHERKIERLEKLNIKRSEILNKNQTQKETNHE